ncbi:MAG: protein kinase [Actinomycetota bacterium]|nr:protein kinase [Actinomycetota bacterium]
MRTSELKTDVTRPAPVAGPPAPAGLVLGRYRLIRRLGAGAFATVWEARDQRLERAVALKILPPERIIGGRFEREARAAARLAHPAIVTLYEAAIDDQGAYLVTELVRGETLGRLLEGDRLSDQGIVDLGISLCDALVHAHGNGVVHRDVKPSNILVPEAPVTPSHAAKLTDFGVARVIGGNALTRTGDVLGTLAYMAPEQAEGLPVGVAADIYSLALVIYEALSGVNPVGVGTAVQRARRLGAHLPPLRRQRRDLPRELAQGIDLALRPRPRERGSVQELRAALVSARPLVDGTSHPSWDGASPPRAPGGFGPRWSANGLEPQGAPEWERAAPPELQLSAPVEAERPTWAEPEPELVQRAPVEEATPRASWGARASAAAAAAATAALLCAVVLNPAPVSPALMALVAGVAVAVAPRLGWLVLVAASTALLALGGLPGNALLLLLAGLIPPLLLPTHGTSWPFAGGALLLGVVGIAGAWPAVAARAGTAWRRAALGIAGALWLVVAGELRGKGLYVAVTPGTPPASVWNSSSYETLHNVIAGPATLRLLLVAAAWGCAAAVLPVMRSRRSVAMDAALALVWSGLLAAAVMSVLGPVRGAGRLIEPHEIVFGALASAGIAIGMRAASGWRIARRTENAGT